MIDKYHTLANAGLVLVCQLKAQLPLEDQAKGGASKSVPLGRVTRPEVPLREQKVTIRVAHSTNRVGSADHWGGNR